MMGVNGYFQIRLSAIYGHMSTRPMTRSLLEDGDGWILISSSVVLKPKVKKRTVGDEKSRWNLTRLPSLSS
jgi:hypothetical protein